VQEKCRIRKRGFVVNRILILLFVIQTLLSCEKSSSYESEGNRKISGEVLGNTIKDGELIFDRTSLKYDDENISWIWKIKANSGFLVIGSEYNVIAPGLVPDALYDLDSMNIEGIGIDVNFDEVPNGSKLIYTVKFLGAKNEILRVHRFTRNWSALKFIDQPNDEFFDKDNIFKLSFGKIGDGRVFLVPVVCFAQELATLKDNIEISKSIPGWEWDVTDINNIHFER
jgi:hypothetical protein